VNHSDRASQNVSNKYTERLAQAGIEPSVGSVGDSYDNALAEAINGLNRAEVIHGDSSKRWNTRPSNGSIGSTIVDCSNPSATSRPTKLKMNVMLTQTTSMCQRD
jgi:transposase InsO family protein